MPANTVPSTTATASAAAAPAPARPPRRLRQVLSLDDFERLARRHLPRPIHAYISGAVEDNASLENEKARFLGKSGVLTDLLKGLGKLDPETRKTEGARINQAKSRVEEALTARRQALADALMNARLAAEAIDVTLPGRDVAEGSLHPVMNTWERVAKIFGSIGFDVADGPEIESDWMNFTALNNPDNHPARSMQDTFYIDGRDSEDKLLLLRTHTSPMQVRYARMHPPPIKVIAIFREAPGASFTVEGWKVTLPNGSSSALSALSCTVFSSLPWFFKRSDTRRLPPRRWESSICAGETCSPGPTCAMTTS
jgi:hypothetical protein